MAELDLVKNNQTVEPWKSALAALKADPSASLTYVMKGPFPEVWRETGNTTGWHEFGTDGTAAYVQAVLWYVTGNPTYATNAKNIINAWTSTLVSLNGADVKLLAAGHAPLWALAGELLRYTNAGWAASDITRCENMLTNIFAPIIADYAASDGANWGTDCILANTAIAVFTNNQTLFDGAWAKFIDPSGCPNDFSVVRNIAYNGQNVESGRDQVHSWSSYEALAGAAEIAYHQGKDPYSVGSNRLQTGAEYWCSYNLGNTVPYDTSIYRCRPGWGPWPVISPTNRGVPTLQGATCNMMYRAYKRIAIESPYTQQMATAMGNILCPANDRNGWTAPFIADALLFNLPLSGPPPPAPTGLTATAVSSTQINLSWTASSGATSYNVKVTTVSGGPYITIAPGVAATTYSDTAAAPGATSYYVVSAVNAGGESPNSTQANATTRPTAPTGLTATAGNAQVSLSWTASSGATSYNVKRATVNGGPYTTVATGVTATSYTNTGLTNGTVYYFVVSAVNAVGESPNSSQVSATPTAGGSVPPAPTGLSATDDNNYAVLTWSASTGATSYKVKRATVSGGPYTVIATPTATSYTDTTVVSGTYYYVVSAVNAVGESANSAQVSYVPGG